MEMSLNNIIKQSKVGQNNRDGRFSPSSTRQGGARRSVATRMPAKRGGGGGGVMRDRNVGGINRKRSTASHRISDRKREAFLGPNSDENFGGAAKNSSLIVSNLDYGVIECDILELFGEFGPVKRVVMHYDRFDRSLGSADIIFERSSDAMKAMKRCRGLPLNGRELKIQLSISEMPDVNPASPAGLKHSSSQSVRNRLGPKRSTHRGGSGPAGKRTAKGKKSSEGKAAGRKMAQKKLLTAEDLDAELDAYMKSVVEASPSH